MPCTSYAKLTIRKTKAGSIFKVITQIALLMAFGPLAAVVELALLYLRKEQAETKSNSWDRNFKSPRPLWSFFSRVTLSLSFRQSSRCKVRRCSVLTGRGETARAGKENLLELSSRAAKSMNPTSESRKPMRRARIVDQGSRHQC
jgi:hypothetical protein